MAKPIALEARLYAVLKERGMHDVSPRRKGPTLPATFMNLFADMTQEQVELVLSLLADYIYHPVSEGFESLAIAFESVFDKSHPLVSSAYAFPLKHWGHIKRGIPKSGDYAIHTARQLKLSEFDEPLKSMQLIPRDYYTLFSISKKRNKQVYIFVDDFVGTGDTAIRTVNEFADEFNINYNEIYVIAMVAMEIGITRLKQLGVNVGVHIIARRGISDSADPLPKKEQDLHIMECMERDINVTHDLRFGYKQSEALVTMDRKTPNNTFPFFWYDNGANRIPPFVR